MKNVETLTPLQVLKIVNEICETKFEEKEIISLTLLKMIEILEQKGIYQTEPIALWPSILWQDGKTLKQRSKANTHWIKIGELFKKKMNNEETKEELKREKLQADLDYDNEILEYRQAVREHTDNRASEQYDVAYLQSLEHGLDI